MKAALRAAECKARVSQVEHNKKAKQKAEATASAFCLAPSAGLERASPLPIIADHSPEGEAFTRSQCFRYTAERRASLPYGATLRIPLRGSGKHCKSLCRPVRAYQIKTRKPKTDRHRRSVFGWLPLLGSNQRHRD